MNSAKRPAWICGWWNLRTPSNYKTCNSSPGTKFTCYMDIRRTFQVRVPQMSEGALPDDE